METFVPRSCGETAGFPGRLLATRPPSAPSESRQGELMAMCLEMAMEAVNRRGVREVEREMELADVLKMDLLGDSVVPGQQVACRATKSRI